MRLQFLGCGDVFGSGGRFNTCMLVDSNSMRFLVDCGASSLIPMKREGIATNSVDTILISHLHGDHFGGIPFFILDAQFTKRQNPLTIAGPTGLAARLPEAMDIFFPGLSKIKQKFEIKIIELTPGASNAINGLSVTPYVVSPWHVRNSPSLALRIDIDGRILTYSGDSDWCSELAEAAFEADVFVCEAYFYEKQIKYHINLKTLEEHIPELYCKRLILTHMHEDTLRRSDSIPYEMAEDGKVVHF